MEDLLESFGGMIVKEKDSNKMWEQYNFYLQTMANNTYRDPIILDLYKRRDEFDCIIMQQSYNEVSYPFNLYKARLRKFSNQV